MENVQIAQLWKRAKESDAPAWLSELILEIKRLQARLETLEQERARSPSSSRSSAAGSRRIRQPLST